jgi:fumarylacetoacetase
MASIDRTHEQGASSWVASANGHSEFPIQNLPFGIFVPPGGDEPRGGVAIGDQILDLAAILEAGLVTGPALAALVLASEATLNAFLASGSEPRQALRLALFDFLHVNAVARPEFLHAAAACTMRMPATVGDYTDFFAGIHHATNAGTIFRPENPLLPNYKYVPIGYHGRSSSIRPSGEPVRRPNGQRKLPAETAPTFGPARNLDIELELGAWVAGGNFLGQSIPIGKAASHIAGFCLLNDWSARDMQAWEYQPLGPFLAKNFATTISPWIVTVEAMAPFRAPQPKRPAEDPEPLPYLFDKTDQNEGALDIDLEVLLFSPKMRTEQQAPYCFSRGSALNLYWTIAQLIAHHTSGGCNLNPGDLLGTGTISTPDRTGLGCLMELTRNGLEPFTLSSGEVRKFLEDGDEIIIRGHARRDGFVSIGFGECRAEILPAF